jgi:hypothetical protein
VAPKSPAAVLAECHAAGRTGIFLLGEHAADRARERNLDIDDIRNALRGSTAAKLQDNGRWKVSGGSDLEGEPVTFAVTVERGLVIVTLF